ncbi:MULTISPECIES: hypothetical protein [Halorussus]|uniref:hypothetical protein n=1 Tax=Halorussus TaxID=1070314 RepID=UPI000E2118AE|nr:MULTISPECIES: hypothetical protein [Halorussus]NHN57651.1 exopolysaccharide biosynthesis protein [Halorussus sp. JP-T4]
MSDDRSYNDDAEYGTDAYDDETAGRDEYRDDVYDDGYADDDEYDSAYDDEDDDGSWWDEGLIGLLLVAGVVLFFFPEPFTSTVGIALIALGIIAWAADALM